ncbi:MULTISPECIES: type VII secretion-associated protein [unclassified Crossiella]|uniref:type VII secretion-associated protein n=1 Tax=unclassified Crossiella TaxID=2620835 RepID=UPI001FFFD024|nr:MULTISPECIES: type VII secretion-associated protein [unclassified Crossiella]MCK2236895.1 type VII secretion-associated protein [Crossiella sp. S99.2]MCK2250563.1 type VII secretion-associated protein [Crossiella sp. S99.1]
MSLRVAIDFGTSSTCVAVSVDGREPQLVVVDGADSVMPSAVYAAADGTLFVGHEAERQAAVDPSRYEPNPKRRIDEGELLLGSAVLPVLDVVRAVLARAVTEARRLAGGAPVDLLVLTHPADWGAIRTRVLRQAGNRLASELVLVPEPVAAAVFHSAGHVLSDGAALAVLDLGGGTVDASVVRRQGESFQVLATRGDPGFGGADIDQLLLEHVGVLVSAVDPDGWRSLVEGRELADRRRRRVLRQDVRGAKETLSRHAYTDVPLPPPFPDAHVTRADLERLIHTPLARAAELVQATVHTAGLTAAQLSAVFLVGGSSRIPLVARLVHEATGIVPTTLDQPETVVARGALRAVAADPHRTANLPPQPPPPPRLPPPSHYTPPPPPPPAPAKTSKTPWLIGGAVVAAVAAVAITVALTTTGNPHASTSGTPTPTSQTPSGQQIAQYSYRFSLPEGWYQAGGDGPTRKVQLRPDGETTGPDVVAVEERALTYDSTTDRNRALSELRSEYQKVEADGYSGFNQSHRFAGKDVVYYRRTAGDATVDFYVVFQGRAQVTVGCQSSAGGRERVRAGCEQVVATLSITG